MSDSKQTWVPELSYYEGVEGPMAHIPFILVPDGEKMPESLYISENKKDTQLVEEDGKEVLQEVMNAKITLFVNMEVLKDKLDKKTYQKIWKATKKPKNFVK